MLYASSLRKEKRIDYMYIYEGLGAYTQIHTSSHHTSQHCLIATFVQLSTGCFSFTA